MATQGELDIAAVAAWFAASSRPTTSPLGDPIIRGPYATLVPVGIDEAGLDVEAFCAQGVLPVFTPQAVSGGFDLTPPQNQGALSDRALHLAWKSAQAQFDAATSEFPAVVVVGLDTPLTTIRDALTAAGLGSLDLATRACLALPLYAFDTVTRIRVAPELPVL